MNEHKNAENTTDKTAPHRVKITCGDTSRTASITVGGQELRVTRALIDIRAGDYTKVTLETYAELVNVEALEKFTRIKFKKIKP